MKAKEFEIKKRNPNWRAMQDIRRSGAGGQHKDKKKAAKQGQVKHKGQMAEGSYTTEKQILTRIRQIMYDRKLSGTESNAGELNRLKQQLKDIRSQQGVAEGDEPDEQYLDKVISDLHKDALGFRPDQEFGQEWMSSSFEEKLEIYNNLLKSLHSDMDEGIGGMIAGGVGQFIGNKIDPLHGEIMRAHGEMAGRKAEYTIRKYMHLLQKALKQQLDSGDNKDESMGEGWNDQDDVSGLSHKEFKRRELEYELGHENKPRENKGMWFYNVPKGKELQAKSYGLRQTKSGKWYSRKPNAVSDKEFGQGRYWEPK